MADRAAILEIIYSNIDEVNEMLSDDEVLNKTEDTAIFGDDSSLDSLGFVNLLVGIEDGVNDAFGSDLSLTDEELLSDENAPLGSVRTITNYILKQLEN